MDENENKDEGQGAQGQVAVATEPVKRKVYTNSELYAEFEKAESMEELVKTTQLSEATLRQKSSYLRGLGFPCRSFAKHQGRPTTAVKELTQADLEAIASIKGITVDEARAISDMTKKSVEERRTKILAGRAAAHAATPVEQQPAA